MGGMVEVQQERREAAGERRKARGVPPGLLFGDLPLLETNSSAAGLVFDAEVKLSINSDNNEPPPQRGNEQKRCLHSTKSSSI